ncbi:hypothetical protein [Actinoallomurus liliacearum]|uniref:hypothetical protein n=1 Tax=Actinoallomurus liliacearum TaxID=1080073 RepID=UPI0031F1378E
MAVLPRISVVSATKIRGTEWPPERSRAWASAVRCSPAGEQRTDRIGTGRGILIGLVARRGRRCGAAAESARDGSGGKGPRRSGWGRADELTSALTGPVSGGRVRRPTERAPPAGNRRNGRMEAFTDGRVHLGEATASTCPSAEPGHRRAILASI